jgi:Family of unknown function (DUF5694)
LSTRAIDYDPHLDDQSQTKILVLASAHLRDFSYQPSVLEPLLAVLQDFGPALIGVEHLPPHLLEVMERRGGMYGQTIQEMAQIRVAERSVLAFGHTAQQLLGVSRSQAEAKVAMLLQPPAVLDPQIRVQAVAYLLAAYDYPSALLQWSYLPVDVHQHNTLLPPAISDQLSQDLRAPHESITVGLALAHRLQHQTIASIDDQMDVAIFAQLPQQFFTQLYDHPEYHAMLGSDFFAEASRRAKHATQNGEAMLQYYRYLNSAAYAAAVVRTEWGMYFRTQLPSGMARSRVAQWEVRNLNIASHIREASALQPGKRMLVIIGAGHKPFLDAYLAQMLDVTIVQLQDLVKPRADR